jgi:hypothetical protein
MPPIQRSDYNPIIAGFVAGEGYVNIPLQVALSRYGQLPSDYGLLPHAATRRTRKTLNLPLGLSIIKLVREKAALKETIARFYERWTRDFRADFKVTIDPFLSRNDASELKWVIEENGALLAEWQRIDIREHLRGQGLISLSTLQSIPEDTLLEKVHVILAKKRRNPAHQAEGEALDRALALTRVKRLLEELAGRTGGDVTSFGQPRLAIHADEIARFLWRVSKEVPLAGVDRLRCVRGQGVEFEFAPRDVSFLTLGKVAGDCTADKSFRQVDRHVENIYWTVFSWFLDRHYQILKVFFDGRFIMKVHLLPLLILNQQSEALFLAVDGIETTPAFREDTRAGDAALLDQKNDIFERVGGEVTRIAEAMGIEHVFAEKFSNTGWVRRELDQFPEVYLHISDVRKIDELEDVFELARRVCAAADEDAPTDVFMELQMKNTYLLPGGATVKGVKPFAVLAGDARVGIPMKRAIGI